MSRYKKCNLLRSVWAFRTAILYIVFLLIMNFATEFGYQSTDGLRSIYHLIILLFVIPSLVIHILYLYEDLGKKVIIDKDERKIIITQGKAKSILLFDKIHRVELIESSLNLGFANILTGYYLFRIYSDDNRFIITSLILNERDLDVVKQVIIKRVPFPY